MVLEHHVGRAMCPHCRTNAPLIYRGMKAYCAACGAPRGVLSGASLTHAGKPAHVAGAVVHAFGWLLFVLGLGFAAIVGLLFALLSATAGLVIGGFFALLSLTVFLLARYGKKRLESEGEEARELRREQALYALAATHGGRLQAYEAAAALDMTVKDADDLLTRLAKQRPEQVDVEIGDQGEVFYEFAAPGGARGFVYAKSWGMPGPWGSAGGFRVAQPSPARRVRVAEPPVAESNKPILDAEFEAIEEEPAPRKART